MSIVIRVDGSTDIGSGHVMRCLGLAEVLRSRGHAVRFACRDLPGAPLDRITDRGFAVTLLPETMSADEDARLCAGLVTTGDAVVVDHYGLDASWERVVRAAGCRVLAIDDLADRRHDCELLLDSTMPGDPERYRALAPNAGLLLGPEFALMSPAFAVERARGIDPDLSDPRILCFFGGSDLPNLSGRALAALSSPDLAQVWVDLVIGSANPHAAALRRQAQARGRVEVHDAQPNLASLMARCAWAIGAGGVTSLERLCLGLPSIVVSIADNQVQSCRALSAAGLIDYAAHYDEAAPEAGVPVTMLSERLRVMLADLVDARERIGWGMSLVDGMGAWRASQALVPSAAEDLRLRRAGRADCAGYFRWANDPDVRAQAWHQDPIRWPAHQQWFARRLEDPDTLMLVLTAEELPVGQVRLERVRPTGAEPRWILDYSLDRAVRGRGWSLLLLGEALRHLPAGAIARAEVRPENEASIRALAGAGWNRLADSPTGSAEGGKVVVFEAQARS